MTHFGIDGRVEHIDIVSGPVLLREEALAYVSHWKANEYGGPRTCAVVLDYTYDDQASPDKPTVLRSDSQHVKIGMALPPCLCDPEFTIGRRRKVLWLF